MDRNFAAVEFAKTIRSRADFRDLIVDLEGKQLACTCPLDRLCHGDVLVRLSHEVRKDSLQQGFRRPVSDKEAREEAKRQSDAWAQPRVKRDVLNRREPTRVMGVVPPIMVGHGPNQRLFSDGAGLCSPGLWPPERRLPATGIESLLHDAFGYELKRLDKTYAGGLDRLMADLAAGRLENDPFPPAATRRLRDFAWDATAHSRCALEEGEVAQPQPILVLLLGSVLKAMGDPDFKIMTKYAVGAPLGLGGGPSTNAGGLSSKAVVVFT